MARMSGSRGLTVVLLVLLLLAGLVDLLRPGSFILATWHRMNPRQTPLERAVKDFKEGRPVTIPRSNRVEGRGTQGVIPRTRSPASA